MRVSNPSIGADSYWSSAFPCGTPSITSTRTTVRASCFSARRWAAVAPTLPAPTTLILLSMQGSRGGSSPSPGVHLAVGVGAQGRERVQGAALPHGQALLGAAVGAAAPRRGDERGERFVRGAAAQAL